MTVLDYVKANFRVYPWRPEGCRLVPDPETAKQMPGGFILDETNDSAPFGGKNPHGDGRWTLERETALFDVPFWAAKVLVFDRDRQCQGCHAPEDAPTWRRRPPNPWNTAGLEVHHIVPFVKGGSNCTHNLALLCRSCHLQFNGDGGSPSLIKRFEERTLDGLTVTRWRVVSSR